MTGEGKFPHVNGAVLSGPEVSYLQDYIVKVLGYNARLDPMGSTTALPPTGHENVIMLDDQANGFATTTGFTNNTAGPGAFVLETETLKLPENITQCYVMVHFAVRETLTEESLAVNSTSTEDLKDKGKFTFNYSTTLNGAVTTNTARIQLTDGTNDVDLVLETASTNVLVQNRGAMSLYIDFAAKKVIGTLYRNRFSRNSSTTDQGVPKYEENGVEFDISTLTGTDLFLQTADAGDGVATTSAMFAYTSNTTIVTTEFSVDGGSTFTDSDFLVAVEGTDLRIKISGTVSSGEELRFFRLYAIPIFPV